MPQGRTKRHSDQEWEKHRGLVLTRYLHDGMTLEEVRSELARKGFLVSSSQLEYRCKTKWGFSKYLNQHTWQDIGTMIQRQRPKEREFFWKGQPLDPKRIIKETNRYRQHRHQLRPAALLHQSRKQQVTTTVSQQGSREFRDNDVALCQDPLQSPRVRKRLPSSQNLYRQPLHGSIGDAEFSAIVESISNNLLRDDEFGHRLQDFTDWLYNFVEAVSVSGINPDTGSITFQAAAHRLWTTIFKYRIIFEHFGNETDEDDRRFLVVVKWLLASVLQTSSLYPSLCVALDATIRSGHTQVASLLWEMTTPSQRSSLQLRPFHLHRITSRRSKEAFLLLRRMLSQESPDWARLTLQSISQYSSLHDFRELLPSASPLFAEEIYLDGQKTASIQVVRLLITACARAEPEELAISKLQAAHDYLFKLGLPASADHVNTDAFMAAAMRGYVQVFDGLVTINQNPGVTNDRGFSALHTAAQYGQLDICKRILQASPPEQHDTDSFPPNGARFSAHAASKTYEALPDDSKEPQSLRIGRVEFFIKSHRKSLCVVCNAAFKACTEGLPELLEFCINHGSDPTSEYALETSGHMQPFISLDAVIQAPVLSLLLGRYSVGQPPRYFASTLPDSELLRRSYFDIGRVGSAVDRVDCAKLILQHGVQPVERHVVNALSVGECEMSQLLLQQDPDASLDAGMRLLEAAICSRNAECIELASRRAGDTYHAGTLCAAVFSSQECSLSRKIALDLISKRSPHNPGTPVESTAIGLAAMYNDQEMLSKLFNAIPSPSQVCNLPWTCSDLIEELKFHVDAFYVIRNDCRKGRPFWHLTDRLCSPLALPAFSGSHEAASTLVRHGIRPDQCACNIAVIRDKQEILSVMLCGQPPLSQWDRGPLLGDHSPLYYAVRGLKHSDFSDCDSDDGYSSDMPLVGQLLSAGADINDPDCEVYGGRSALQVAAETGKFHMANFLFHQGAQVNGRVAKRAGATALQLAVMCGHSDMVEMLLANGADVDAPAAPEHGRTCLQGAAEEGRLGISELLIARNIRTGGQYRVDYVFAVVLAEMNGHQVLAQRIKSYGGWAEWDQIAGEILRDMNNREFCRRMDLVYTNLWLSLTNLDKAEIEAKVRLRLSGRADIQDGKTKSSMMVQNIAQASPWLYCPPMSPRSFMPYPFVPQSPQDLIFFDMSTPPQCLDDEEGWFHDRGPSFMRNYREQEGEEEMTLDLD